MKVIGATIQDVEAWKNGGGLKMASLPPAQKSRVIWHVLCDSEIVHSPGATRGKSRQVVIILQQTGMVEIPQVLWRNFLPHVQSAQSIYIVLIGGTLLRRQVSWQDHIDFISEETLPFAHVLISSIGFMLLRNRGILWRSMKLLSRMLPWKH